MTEEKGWVRLVGKDGVYLVEGEDYTVDREKGILKHRVRYRRRAGGKMSSSGPCPRCGGYYSTTCGQGSGWFIYGGLVYDPVAFDPNKYDNKILTDGVFTALDTIKEAATHYISDRRLWKTKTEPMLTQRVEVCMKCGFIYGEATDLQKRLWGVHSEERSKLDGGGKKR